MSIYNGWRVVETPLMVSTASTAASAAYENDFITVAIITAEHIYCPSLLTPSDENDEESIRLLKGAIDSLL